MLRLTIASLCCGAACALQLPASSSSSSTTATASASSALSRRALLGGAAALALAPSSALAYSLETTDASTKSSSGAVFSDDLPPKAKQAYLQYLPQLQLDADFFLFELYPMLAEPGRWDRITELTTSTDIGSAASVSRLDREFITPMRILSLSFPPDLGGEEMTDAIDVFQKAMFSMSRQARKGATTGNVAGPSSKEVAEIYTSWETGRTAMNSFFKAVNEGSGVARLVALPAKGDLKAYPRSKTLYTQLLKDAALCRNRGGEQLAGLWGQLMVYGTVPGVNPCGNAAQQYYSQGL